MLAPNYKDPQSVVRGCLGLSISGIGKFTVLLFFLIGWSFLPLQAATLSDAQAREIAREAYLYFYPLVSMDLTKRQLESLPEDHTGAFKTGRTNWLTPVLRYPTATDKTVVRPNFDTLYTTGFIDVGKEPMVLSVPDTNERYYLLVLLDLWTDAFASLGWRTTGTGAGYFLIASPLWKPGLRAGLAKDLGLPPGTVRIDTPTDQAWLIGRIFAKGSEDYAAVNKIQKSIVITPLSQWGKPPVKPAPRPDPSVDVVTPVKVQVDRMPGKQFFAYAAKLLNTTRPHLTDQAQLARIKHLGISREKRFDFNRMDTRLQQALQEAPKEAQKQMAQEVGNMAPVVNGWVMNTHTMGVYGNYYLKRAAVAQLGLGANVADDAVYLFNLSDNDDKPLNGTHSYILRFPPGKTPPAEAFWSLTVYDSQGFQVDNTLNRFAISSWMDLKKGSDGSVVIYIQSQSPGKDKEANWLPAPKGDFNVLMRLYAPKPAVLFGRWSPPPIVKSSTYK